MKHKNILHFKSFINIEMMYIVDTLTHMEDQYQFILYTIKQYHGRWRTGYATSHGPNSI